MSLFVVIYVYGVVVMKMLLFEIEVVIEIDVVLCIVCDIIDVWVVDVGVVIEYCDWSVCVLLVWLYWIVCMLL